MLIAAGMVAPSASAECDNKPSQSATSDTAVKDTPTVTPDTPDTPTVDKPPLTVTDQQTASAAIEELVRKLETRLADLERRYAAKDGQPADTQPAPIEDETKTDSEKPTEEPDKTDTPEAQEAPPVTAPAGTVVLPKTGKPADPGNKLVRSPNPSPLVDPATLKGPKVTVKKGDDINKVFDKPLAAGTVVTLPRDTVFDKRITITGEGTKDQPVLVQAAPGKGAPPTFTTTQPGEYKDAGVIATRGTNVQLDGIAVKDTPSIGFSLGATDGVANQIETSKTVNGAWIVSDEHGGQGDGTKVWNSYFHDGVMMPDTPGDEDDYGAAGIAIQADNVTIEGVTGHNLKASSPDYDQYGGDGALFEVWMKGDNLRVAHSAVKGTARVLEAGGLKDGTANVTVEGVYADGLVDAPFHFQEGGGPYGALKTNMTEKDNNIISSK